MSYLFRKIMLRLAMIISVAGMQLNVNARNIVVADSVTHMPLPNASLYNRKGKTVGISNSRGMLPNLLKKDFPITIRYIGYEDRVLELPAEWSLPGNDTIFLSEEFTKLPEVEVKSKKVRMLHILAYLREYSQLSTYSDTVFLFREKMIDYMLPAERKTKFNGWTNPRTLSCKSYYKFTNTEGLDSVSDACNNHFSWSDWMGLPPEFTLPEKLRLRKEITDTIMGKYYPREIWKISDDSLIVGVDVLSDSTCRKWVPNFNGFFQKEVDFEKFDVRFDYSNVDGGLVTPLDLNRYVFNIESRGRAREMFRFNKYYQPIFVSTTADVYILDKEYITVGEAKKWANRKFDVDEIGIFEPVGAPELQPDVKNLIARVNSVDKGQVRLGVELDRRLIGIKSGRNNFTLGRRALSILKTLSGISRYKSNRNFKKNWNNMRKKLQK